MITPNIKLLTTNNSNNVKVSILLEFLKTEYTLIKLLILSIDKFNDCSKFLVDLQIPEDLRYQINMTPNDDELRKNPSAIISFNPNHSIELSEPTTECESVFFQLTEPASILLFLCEKFDNSRKYSYDIKSPYYFESMSWIFWQFPNVIKLSYEILFNLNTDSDLEADLKIQNQKFRQVSELKRIFKVLERQISYNKRNLPVDTCIVGDHISVVDILCFPCLNLIVNNLNMQDEINNYESLSRWYNSLKKLDEIKLGDTL